jgi:hypothetical protein
MVAARGRSTPSDPGSFYADAAHFQAWGSVNSFASEDLVQVRALGSTFFVPQVVNLIVPTGREYGAAVALHDDLLFVGVPGDDTLGTDAGCVEVWQFDGSDDYGLIDTLYSPSPQPGDRFGRSLDVSPDGTTLAIGEVHNEAIPAVTNSGYIRLADIAPDDTVTLSHDVFAWGSSVTASNENLGFDLDWAADGQLTAGAPGTGISGFVAWFFGPPAPWIEVDQSPALAGTGGVEPTQVMEGAIIADGAVLLGVRDALPLSSAFMIMGLSTINAPAKGGILYPSLNLLLTFSTNAAGEMILPTHWPTSSVALGAFDTYIQWWVLDAGGPVGFSATAGGVIHQY